MQSSPSTRARVVLLGASNLAAGLRHVIRAALARLEGPLEVFAAAGKGRSYGQLSQFLGRVLPGIDACGLWPALDAAPRASTFALVTDVGNDIAFGASAAQVQAWLEITLDRLEAHGARVVLTGLPLVALERMPAWEFRLWARVLFPWHEIQRERVLAAAREMDERLAELARARGLTKLDPRPEWYGRDPIHVRSALRAQAWNEYVTPWNPARGAPDASRTRFRGRLWYERVRVLGVECGAPQPCAKLGDSSSIRLY